MRIRILDPPRFYVTFSFVFFAFLSRQDSRRPPTRFDEILLLHIYLRWILFPFPTRIRELVLRDDVNLIPRSLFVIISIRFQGVHFPLIPPMESLVIENERETFTFIRFGNGSVRGKYFMAVRSQRL